MAKRIERILVVDDNRDAVLTLGILLRSEGYVVQLAESGAQALRLAETMRPDVVLLDLHMPPGRTGFDVAHELHVKYSTQCPVLIAVTAHSDAKSRGLAEFSGFRHFVAKPYDPQELLRMLGSLDQSSDRLVGD